MTTPVIEAEAAVAISSGRIVGRILRMRDSWNVPDTNYGIVSLN
jgi:hypothetical protein